MKLKLKNTKILLFLSRLGSLIWSRGPNGSKKVVFSYFSISTSFDIKTFSTGHQPTLRVSNTFFMIPATLQKQNQTCTVSQTHFTGRNGSSWSFLYIGAHSKYHFWTSKTTSKWPFFVIFWTFEPDSAAFRFHNDLDTTGPCKVTLGGLPAQTVWSYLY